VNRKDYDLACAETERLQRELDITNADHVALWLEANTIPDEPMNQCISWLACRIVEAYEAAKPELSPHPLPHSGDCAVESTGNCDCGVYEVSESRAALLAARSFCGQVKVDLASAHAEICKLQGLDPAAYSWPEWSPQANTMRWIDEKLIPQIDEALSGKIRMTPPSYNRAV
jgi:hypothetical protein